MYSSVVPTLLAILVFLNPISAYLTGSDEAVLAKRSMSLDNRQPDPWVNEVFKENILLNIAYLRGDPSLKMEEKPFTYSFTLQPGETFAYHEDVLPTYSGKVAKTTNSHFNYQEGYKSDGYLFGDGVCHLASLFYWVAKDAGLKAEAPTNHDFMPIPEIPKEYGVSIYSMPGLTFSNALQNLYITNSKDYPVEFLISYKNDNLSLAVVELN